MSKIEKRIDKAAMDYAYNGPYYADDSRMRYESFMTGAKWVLSHQWVSVEDTLPPFNGDIILRRDETYRVALCMWIDGRFVDMTKNDDFVATHWMPIPPLPEKRKEREE